LQKKGLVSIGKREVREKVMPTENYGLASILGVEVCRGLHWLGEIEKLGKGNTEQYLREKTIQEFLAKKPGLSRHSQYDCKRKLIDGKGWLRCKL
jgi:hypothetical protein